MRIIDMPIIKRFARNINNTVNPADMDISKAYESLRNSEAYSIFEERKTGESANLPPIKSSKDDLLNAMRRIKQSKETIRLSVKEKKQLTTLPTMGTSNYMVLKPFYRYDRIDQFFQKESYFSRSIIRQVETLMRNGYDFMCEDSNVVRNLRIELNSMKMRGHSRIEGKISRMASDLLKYGICIFEKERDATNDIENFRFINPQNVTLYIDKYTYNILGADDTISMGRKSRKPGGFTPTYSNTFVPGILVKDLCIITVYDAGELVFPEPPCFASLDDILSLRSLEETVEMLAFQFGSPLLHTQVGEAENAPTDADVRRVHNTIVEMAPNGMITTDYKTKITSVNLLTGSIDLMPAIEHFKNRVLVGSGSSTVLVGEGGTANRNTAATIDDAQADHCMNIGTLIAEAFTYNIIPDILGYDTNKMDEYFDSNGEPIIRMQFNEVKLEKKIAKDNHTTLLYQSNLITGAEARRKMHTKPLTQEEEGDTYVKKVQIPLKSAGPTTIGSGTSGSVKQKTMPSNQHTTKSGPGSTKN